MRIFWFGGTTVRVHVGGEMLVGDADGVLVGVDRAELLSGTNREFGLDGMGLPAADPGTWKPRRVRRAIDDAGSGPVQILSIGVGAVLIEAAGEPPLVLVSVEPTDAGRWSRDAVVVCFAGCDPAAVLAAYSPKLLALAVDPLTADEIIPTIEDDLDGTGLVVLEPGLALEV
jgi:hypothetical protein